MIKFNLPSSMHFRVHQLVSSDEASKQYIFVLYEAKKFINVSRRDETTDSAGIAIANISKSWTSFESLYEKKKIVFNE